MKKALLLLFLAAPAPVLCQTPEPAPYHHQRVSMFRELKIGKRDIVFVGNSITNGCEWSEMLGSRRVKNRGINADRSFDILARIGQITGGRPKKVFLMAGTNDLAIGYSPESVVENIAAIADRFAAESPRTRLYIQSILPVNDDVSEMYSHRFNTAGIIRTNRLLKAMCEERGLVYIDVWSALADGEDKLKAEYTNDGLHLMMEGYTAWIKVLEPYIR